MVTHVSCYAVSLTIEKLGESCMNVTLELHVGYINCMLFCCYKLLIKLNYYKLLILCTPYLICVLK